MNHASPDTPNARSACSKVRLKTLRTFACLVLCLFSNNTLAGGDAVLGKVIGFSGKDGNYSFRFLQTEGGAQLVTGCQELTIAVRYERVPWFSWIPFVHSSHPTKEQTVAAAAYMQNANLLDQEIYFGYMGYGLAPIDDSCSFASRGLAIEQDPKRQSVFSYHDPF